MRICFLYSWDNFCAWKDLITMDELQQIWKRHVYIAKASTAFIYGVLVSIAMNFFWEPGHIYSSGITGLAQLLATLTANLPVHLSTALLIFILNVPLFILAWFQIGRRFTFFTVLAVFCSSLMIKSLQPITLTHDPIICALLVLRSTVLELAWLWKMGSPLVAWIF